MLCFVCSLIRPLQNGCLKLFHYKSICLLYCALLQFRNGFNDFKHKVSMFCPTFSHFIHFNDIVHIIIFLRKKIYECDYELIFILPHERKLFKILFPNLSIAIATESSAGFYGILNIHGNNCFMFFVLHATPMLNTPAIFAPFISYMNLFNINIVETTVSRISLFSYLFSLVCASREVLLH